MASENPSAAKTEARSDSGLASLEAARQLVDSTRKRTQLLPQIQIGTTKAAALIARRLSPRARVAVGERLGTLARWFDRLGYARAQRRIEDILELDPIPAARIARECYRNFGRFVVEGMALPTYGEPAAAELFDVHGFEHVRRAASAGRGALLFSAHFGNWELAALHQAAMGFPMTLVVKPSRNGLIEKQLTIWRESSGNKVISREGAIRKLTRELRSGGLASILIDQHVATPPMLYFPFLGRSASHTPALGFLALRLRVPVIPFSAVPLNAGRHRIDYYPPLEAPTTGAFEERVLEMTAEASRHLEKWIRQHPSYWLWLHDRWKPIPPWCRSVLPDSQVGWVRR